MRKFLLSLVCFLTGIVSVKGQSVDSDPLVRTMREEINYSMDQFRQMSAPVYFLSLRLNDVFESYVSSSFGVSLSNESRQRLLTPQVRFGTPELDNFKFENQSGQRNYYGPIVVPLAEDVSPLAVRQAVWQGFMNKYSAAQSMYGAALSKMGTNADNEDKSPCFSVSPVETYYEQPLPQSVYNFDREKWSGIMDKVSSVFKECRDLENGEASVVYNVERIYVVNSDGTAVVQNRRSIRIMLQAAIRAEDGMTCPLYTDFFGYTEDKMPDVETLVAAARDLMVRLENLREAPIADPYAGPAILSSSASGVFFHEIFGHRLEGHRLKSGGQTFRSLVGEKVLPESFTVISDPTLTQYAGTDMNGSYKYDDEGVKSRRVVCLENGVLKEFLMDRTPIDGFPSSNGHGRASTGYDPVSRQSNLIIETSKPYTDAELRQMLIEEAKRQGKEYGYFFNAASSGLTYLGDQGSINSFNVDPLEVYRVYVDGRPDQLVRGVKLIGTPLAMFSGIEAAGSSPHVFTGQCGAESGWVPVTASSPAIFVSKIETQRSETGYSLPCVLKLPDYRNDDSEIAALEGGELIFRAIEDEMNRAAEGLKVEGHPLPYFIDHTVYDGYSLNISSRFGQTVSVQVTPERVLGSAVVLIGDSMLTSRNTRSYLAMRGNQLVQESAPWSLRVFQLGQRLDYDGIRRRFWLTDDASYKDALNSYAQKVNDLKNKPLPEDDINIQELPKMPASRLMDDPVVIDREARQKLEALANTLSGILSDFPTLYNTNVRIDYNPCDVYHVTSEGVRVRFPLYDNRVNVEATMKSQDGSTTRRNLYVPFNELEDLPSVEEFQSMVREFAQLTVDIASAPSVKEFYIGPLLVEDESVSQTFAEIVKDQLTAQRNNEGSGKGGMMLGKRIMDAGISIHVLADRESYNGQKLLANYRFDADGVVPQKDMEVISNGIFRNMIAGRFPAVGAEKSRGNMMQNSLSDRNAAFAIMHVTAAKTKPLAKVRSALIAEGRKSGLDHVYIKRKPLYGDTYLIRLNLATGKEEIVRATGFEGTSRKDLMHIIAVADEELVVNHRHDGNDNYSAIVPKSILIENVEMTLDKPSREEDFTLKNPALR